MALMLARIGGHTRENLNLFFRGGKKARSQLFPNSPCEFGSYWNHLVERQQGKVR
ncbi:MAG: hypothetical protein JWM68_5020 [Verrucomicrobiales bacterium]|nr:hypothetical protein [Verrucomicrobiales bacterium]